ncbi:MAG: c-type cytochrome, partial [Anaerolineales bacterium]|nr:c-type cytochrome [Anaerolineales bacterium]
AKLGLMLPLLLAAAVNLLYIKPRLRQAEAAGPAAQAILRRFNNYVRAEAILAFLIILAAGFLTDAQRGADAPLLADEGGRAILQQQVEDLTFTMTIEPALVGNNVFDIAVTDAAGQPVSDISEMDIRFTFLEQSLGASEAVPEELDTGLYRLEGAFISLIGEWQVEVAVRRPGSYDAFAPYRLNAGLGGAIQDAQAERSLWDALASTTTLLNNAIIGFGLILLGLIWFGFTFRVADSRVQLIPLLAFSLAAFWIGGQQLNTFFGTEYTPSKFLNNPVLPDQTSIQQGQAAFEAECASCHGIQGLGNGEAALGLNPAPANFTDGHTDAHSDGDLFFWIRNGKEGTAMPAFNEQYTETETWHIVNYVRRLSQQ